MSDTTVGAARFEGTAPVEERRQSLRSKMTQIVYVNMEAENGGILLDISLSGLGFQLAGSLAKGNQISFRLSTEGIEDVEILADVAWLDKNRKRGGLRFGEIPEDVGERIRNWARPTPPVSGAGDRVPVVAANLLPPPHVSKPAPSRPLLISGMVPYSLTREPLQSGLPRVRGTESNLGGLANPLRAVPNLRQLDSAYQLQLPAHRERHLGTIALSVFVSLIVAAGAFVFVNKREAGELLIHLGERVSGDYSRQSTNGAPAAIQGSSSVTSPEPYDSASDTSQAASAQTASNSNAADSAIASHSPREEHRPDEQLNSEHASLSSGFNGKEAMPAPAGPMTDQSSRSVTSRSPSPSESATTTGQLRPAGSSEFPREAPGHTDLVLAQQYLRGNSAPKDRDMATHLLWIAVGEGNPQAELELADLYLRSDGVPVKNCAQARILLNDASSSGNVEASQQLAKLRDYGCR